MLLLADYVSRTRLFPVPRLKILQVILLSTSEPPQMTVTSSRRSLSFSFHDKTLYAFLFCCISATVPVIIILLYLITLQIMKFLIM